MPKNAHDLLNIIPEEDEADEGDAELQPPVNAHYLLNIIPEEDEADEGDAELQPPVFDIAQLIKIQRQINEILIKFRAITPPWLLDAVRELEVRAAFLGQQLARMLEHGEALVIDFILGEYKDLKDTINETWLTLHDEPAPFESLEESAQANSARDDEKQDEEKQDRSEQLTYELILIMLQRISSEQQHVNSFLKRIDGIQDNLELFRAWAAHADNLESRYNHINAIAQGVAEGSIDIVEMQNLEQTYANLAAAIGAYIMARIQAATAMLQNAPPMPKSARNENTDELAKFEREVAELYDSVESRHMGDEVQPQASSNQQIEIPPEAGQHSAEGAEGSANVVPEVPMQEESDSDEGEGGSIDYVVPETVQAARAAMQPLNEAVQRVEAAIALWDGNIRMLDDQITNVAGWQRELLREARSSAGGLHAGVRERMVALRQRLVNLNNAINQGQMDLQQVLLRIAGLMQEYMGLRDDVEEYNTWAVRELEQVRPTHGYRDHGDEPKYGSQGSARAESQRGSDEAYEGDGALQPPAVGEQLIGEQRLVHDILIQLRIKTKSLHLSAVRELEVRAAFLAQQLAGMVEHPGAIRIDFIRAYEDLKTTINNVWVELHDERAPFNSLASSGDEAKQDEEKQDTAELLELIRTLLNRIASEQQRAKSVIKSIAPTESNSAAFRDWTAHANNLESHYNHIRAIAEGMVDGIIDIVEMRKLEQAFANLVAAVGVGIMARANAARAKLQDEPPAHPAAESQQTVLANIQALGPLHEAMLPVLDSIERWYVDIRSIRADASLTTEQIETLEAAAELHEAMVANSVALGLEVAKLIGSINQRQAGSVEQVQALIAAFIQKYIELGNEVAEYRLCLAQPDVPEQAEQNATHDDGLYAVEQPTPSANNTLAGAIACAMQEDSEGPER